MGKVLLALNAGSSSIKFTVFSAEGVEESSLPSPSHEALPVLARGQIDGIHNKPRLRIQTLHDDVTTNHPVAGWKQAEEASIGISQAVAIGEGHDAVIEFLLGYLFEQLLVDHSLIAVGHRIVHGGQHYSAPTLIDAQVIAALESLVPLAPLHQPHNLTAVRSIAQLQPALPQIACFDTAFHRTLPLEARMFALPYELMQKGVRRYGFHGLSYESIAQQLTLIDPQAAIGRAVVAHLGSGASVCGLLRGHSYATSMGMTPLDGLPMATRCGNVDPGVLLYLLKQNGGSIADLQELLYTRSGLLGISGRTSDMRQLLESQHPNAKQAVEYFVYRASCEIASIATALEGMDALVFTGGIGQNSHMIRQCICARLKWLGISCDSASNQSGEQLISHLESKARVWVIATDEEGVIANQVMGLLCGKTF